MNVHLTRWTHVSNCDEIIVQCGAIYRTRRQRVSWICCIENNASKFNKIKRVFARITKRIKIILPQAPRRNSGSVVKGETLCIEVAKR